MDLGAATSPVGETAVALGDRVEGPASGLRRTSLQLGPAFGDGLATSFANREITAFDDLGAPFWYDLGAFAPAAVGPSLAERLRDFQRLPASVPSNFPAHAITFPVLGIAADSERVLPRLYLASTGVSAAAKASHFALAGQNLIASFPVASNLTATAITTEGVGGQEPSFGASILWRMPETSLGLRAGWMDERRSLLGTVPDGAFGDLAASAVFAGIEADADLGSWRMGATAEVGSVTTRPRHGLLKDISPLATSAIALHATRPTPNGGAFRVSLSQPLRVEDGKAALALPSGRTTGGEVIRSNVSADLEPSGRQIDLALLWQRPLDLGVLRLGTTVSRDPGHRKHAATEFVLLSGWHLSF